MAQQRRVSRALQTFTFGIWGMKEVPGGQTGLYLGAQIPPSLAAQPAIVARVSFSRRTHKSRLFVLERVLPSPSRANSLAGKFTSMREVRPNEAIDLQAGLNHNVSLKEDVSHQRTNAW